MNPYYEQMILSASPIELIRLLYQRAISSIRDAREHLRNKRVAERSACINKAYDVLTELMASLRSEAAPELSERLRGLYCYMQERLIEANFRQSDAPMDEVIRLLTTLAEAWSACPEPAERLESPSRNSWATAGHNAEEPARLAVSA